jgi:glycosyltransferase involved in cell wall biosynthesis
MRRERPKVLFLINSLTGGGAERIMSLLLEHSADKRADCEIALALLDQEPAAYPIPHWVTVYQLDSRFGLLRSLRGVRHLVDELRPTVTISFLTRANVANCLAMQSVGRPAIISERVNTDMQLGSGPRGMITKAIVRHAYPKASRVIAVSAGVRETLVDNYRIDASTIDVVPNPVDRDWIARQAAAGDAKAPDQPFLFAMGRLVPNKNFALLLRAFARSKVPGKLVIAGEGPQRAELLQLAHSLGIADRLVLPGYLVNPHALLARATAFVLSSNAEGFPNALVEALTLGVPVIATNCADGPSEILAGVRRQEIIGTHISPAGILVPVNDPHALSNALLEIQDPALRARLSEGGRQASAAYSIAGSVQRYWEIIERELATFPVAGKQGHL